MFLNFVVSYDLIAVEFTPIPTLMNGRKAEQLDTFFSPLLIRYQAFGFGGLL